MLLSNNLFCILMTSLWIPFSHSSLTFYMCMFLCGCRSSTICLLRNLYIWERLPFIWYPIYFESPCSSSLILWWLWKENFSWVLVLFLFASLRTQVLLKIFDFMLIMVSMLILLSLAFGIFNWFYFPIGIPKLVNILL